MSAFSEAALEKKLSELSNSQQSVQTLSLWLIHHRKHSKTIVGVWFNELKKGPEFTQDFAPVIVDAFKHVYRDGEEGCKKQLGRVLSIWQERAVYESSLLEQLSQVLCKSPQTGLNPEPTSELIRALQELENAASGDALLRRRISLLPAEVQDAALLHREYKRKLARVTQVRKELRSRLNNLPDGLYNSK
ncbi:unnamed protein product [Menidia menidia]|uniref:(Atlantic silverside) hypothetical protein n=1 Tax=Menidia menidia TaxID=238744 RepID=A0A8S4ALH7_9TELE|nr:unnamed protein product [Menidia menidia]